MFKINFSVCFCALFFLFLSSISSAQQDLDAYEFIQCGSPSGKLPWLEEYQRDPSVFQQVISERSQTTTFLPLTFHIVYNDDSSGVAQIDKVLQSFCQLNEDFAGTDIQFYIKAPINYIYDTDLYIHDSVRQGGIKMLQYNVDSSINVYFVASPAAGNCGYNLPYAGVGMSYSCLTGHTFAHELGHALSMPHTFLGWEGGVSWDGSPINNFPNPAPQQVTINYTDFKDTLYTDTLIIDTVLVEYVARTGTNANCAVAADGFCDTPADYLAYRWACNGNRESTVPQLDPDSVSFLSDGWFIMSYALSTCQVGFSQEQNNAMLAFALSEKPELLSNQNPYRDTINDFPDLLSPPNGNSINSQSPVFRWTAVEGATHYFLQIDRDPFGTRFEEAIVTDTFFQSSLDFPPRPAAFPYTWRVYPFNLGNTCKGFGPDQNFNTISNTAVEQVNSQDLNWNIAPNPLAAGKHLKINIASSKNHPINICIYNAQGQQLWQYTQQINVGTNNFEINLPHPWSTGLYFIEISSSDGQRSVKKLAIQ